MKKIISAFIAVLMVLLLSACGKNEKSPTINELASVSPEEAEALFEDMTDLAAAGKYDKAVESYVAGAAGAESTELLNWYFNQETCELVVSGSGDMPDFENT